MLGGAACFECKCVVCGVDCAECVGWTVLLLLRLQVLENILLLVRNQRQTGGLMDSGSIPAGHTDVAKIGEFHLGPTAFHPATQYRNETLSKNVGTKKKSRCRICTSLPVVSRCATTTLFFRTHI